MTASSLTAEQQRRWQAEVTYRCDAGPELRTFKFEEIDDLHDIIETGPHWDTIICIEIYPLNPTYDGLTIEQSERL